MQLDLGAQDRLPCQLPMDPLRTLSLAMSCPHDPDSALLVVFPEGAARAVTFATNLGEEGPDPSC